MRIWHYRLLPYLPELQFKGQLRELVAIMRAWRDNGTTNHLLINRVMDYDPKHLTSYFILYDNEHRYRYGIGGISPQLFAEFLRFADYKVEEDFLVNETNGQIHSLRVNTTLFPGWHDDEYLKICMANLYEKHEKAKGKTQISQKEWQRVLEGYKTITGEYWKI
jgi:uncharacterized protein (TIGR02328 family)